jgi:carboxyl-terminal processing protease
MLRANLVLVLLCLCFSPAFAQQSAPQQAKPTAAPVDVYDQAWTIARDHFFDPEMNGIDWDAAGERHRADAEDAETPAELSAAINALLKELDTSHCGHFTPDDTLYYHLLDVMSGNPAVADLIRRKFRRGIRYEGIEAWLLKQEDSLFITGVWPGGNADRAGLRKGDEILEIDGEPPTPVASFRARAGEDVELTILRTRGGPTTTKSLHVVWIQPSKAFVSSMKKSVQILERDGHDIGYIQILSYAGDKYQDVLLHEIFRGKLARADALIIDIRGGLGGASPSYVDPFMPGPVMTMTPREGDPRVQPRRWNRPVALLIDEGSRSGKEVIAHGFREYNLGPTIGERTAGAVVGGTVFPLADDSLLYIAVADVEVDGQRLEGKGVEPTIEVPFDPRYAAGKDPQLEAAIAELARMANTADR